MTSVPGAHHDPAKPGALAGAVRVVSGVTLLSRLGGLVRDVMLARIFGDAPVHSAFQAGFAIPNMFRRLFGEGALSAAFLPEYARAHNLDPAAADRLGSLVIMWLLLLTSALTVLLELALVGVLLLAPGGPNRVMSIELVMVMLPFMPLVCAAAILGGMLQVHGRFGPAASGPILLNGFIIGAGVYTLATGRTGELGTAFLLGAVTVASGLTQCLWFAWLLRPHVRWTRVFDGARGAAARMLRRFVPVLIGMGTLQINAFLDTLIATWPLWVGPTVLGIAYPMDEKSTTILALTQRLYQFPLGVFGIAVATAVFPMLARCADDRPRFASTLRRGLRLSFFIGLPASVGLILVRHDLTTVLFSGGRTGLGPDALARSAAVLAGFAPGVWAYSLNHVLTRAFYARGDMRTPMRVALAMVGLNLALNLALMWSLREAGLAWATSISAACQCAILATLARRFGDAGPGELVGSFLRTAAAAAAMAALVVVVARLFPAPTGWTDHAVRLGVLCVTGGVAYGAFAAILGSHELRLLLRRE